MLSVKISAPIQTSPKSHKENQPVVLHSPLTRCSHIDVLMPPSQSLYVLPIEIWLLFSIKITSKLSHITVPTPVRNINTPLGHKIMVII